MLVTVHLFYLPRPPRLFFPCPALPRWELISANSLMPASGWVWSRGGISKWLKGGRRKLQAREHGLSLPCPFSISVSVALSLRHYSLGQCESPTAPAPTRVLWQDCLPDSSSAAGLLMAPHRHISGCLTIPICTLHPDSSSLSDLFSEIFSFGPNSAPYQDCRSHNIPHGTCSQTLFMGHCLSPPYCPHRGGPP